MKKVMVFGVFDHFHKGHEFFLKKAKNLGDVLLVAVASDTYVEQHKESIAHKTQEERIAKLLSLPSVDEAFPGDTEEGSFNVIVRNEPDLIVLGHDQQKLGASIEAWLSRNGGPRNFDLLYLEVALKRNRYSSSNKRKTQKYAYPLSLIFAGIISILFGYLLSSIL